MYELQGAIFYLARMESQKNMITPEELKEKLYEVLKLLAKANEILSFDSPSSGEGLLAKSIPQSIQGVNDILALVSV
jgi:hypothetical protein